MKNIKKRHIYALIILLPILFLIATLCVGRYSVSLQDVALSFVQLVSGKELVSPETFSIVISVRLMRGLQGLLVGASLAASGACFQSIFRNPLVSGGMLGVSNGAGFGAALSILLFNNALMTLPFSFSFGVLAVILSYLVGKISGGNSTITLVLGGTVIQSIFSSLLSLMKYLADTANQLPAITFWLMGSLASTKDSDLLIASVPMVIGLAGMMIFRSRLNVLSMGDREAHALGINVNLNKMAIIAFSTLATAGAVSVSGVIGWIGLVVPHICRMLMGNNNRLLIPASISFGACFMVLVDTICRTITASEIPIGIVTALAGGPFFVYLLKKNKAKGW